MPCMTSKLRHVVCTWRSQILRKKKLHAFAMGENEYAFLCTATAFWLSKSLKFHFFIFFNGIYETRPLKNYATLWCRAWRISYDMSSAHGEGKFCQKNITRIPSGRKRICIFMHSNGFLAVKIPEISFFNGIYETLPLKNYATLWCGAWRISYNMSSAHGEDKFCEKKYNMHSQWAKTNMHYYAQ